QVEDAVAGVALVVLLHGVGDRVGDAGAVALEHERDPVADDLLELDQALLRAHLVVERHDLELASEHASRLVDGVGGVLELVEPVLAGGREGPRQRVDVGDADGIGGRRAGREPGQQCHDHGEHENALGHGPEAGVWVIAETTELGTRFARIAVTDDHGRYVIPDLPQATYSVWVRGYGLVDSPKVKSARGRILNLTAVPAPNAAAAAEYYPAIYWFSMLKIPDRSLFPGTGPDGNGMPVAYKTQEQWLNAVQLNGCGNCHQL